MNKTWIITFEEKPNLFTKFLPQLYWKKKSFDYIPGIRQKNLQEARKKITEKAKNNEKRGSWNGEKKIPRSGNVGRGS